MILLYTWLLILLHLCVHEIGHAAAAHLIGVHVLSVKIGGGEPVFKAGKYAVALWMTGGYTEVSAEDLAEKGILQKLFFFEGGTMAGLLMQLALPAVLDRFYAGISTAVFFVLLFTNHCPFLPGSDLSGFLSAVKNSRAADKRRCADDKANRANGKRTE